MIQTVNSFQFREAFRTMGRANQFSYEGLGALFDYLEEADFGCYELDVIALCCDYSEDTVAALIESYSIDTSDADPEDERTYTDAVRAYLEENTSIVAEFDGSFLYAQF